jgi:VCBS repeat-containing protein
VGAPPAGWPAAWGNNVVDYGMDQTVVNQAGAAQVKAALLAIPSLSITTDLANLFDPVTGIYANAYNDGRDWERDASVELINPDGSGGFQINAGLRVRGGYSRSSDNPKHAFRLFFRSEYGDSSLEYPLFGAAGVDSFKKLDLRTAQNYSWSFGGDPSNTMIQDGFARQSQGDMGQPYTRSIWVNLYLDGQYWGIYQIEERPEAEYAASYFGGEAANYDVIKPEAGPYTIYATDGNLDAYQRLWQFVTTQNLANNANYFHLQGKNASGINDPSIPNEDVLLDVDNLITYMTGILHGGNLDAPISAFLSNQGVNNFFAIRDRTGRSGFKYVQHDAEHTLHNVNENRNGPYPAGENFDRFNPQFLHQQLMANPEYRLKFADAMQKFFFNDGPMTAANSAQRFQNDVDQLDVAIIAESARWGDAKRPTSPLGRANWLNAVASMQNFLANRNPILLQQFRDNGLFPNVGAPQYLINGVLRNSGEVLPGDVLRLAAGSGLVYYTTDGSDPRLVGGGINPAAQVYDPSATATTLLASGASWKYYDQGGDLGTAWQGSGYNDAAWSSGNAELGYGDGDEATVVGYGPNGSNKYITTYFRKSFNVADTAGISGLKLQLKRDDGAVIYINGVEAARTNMPTGAITAATPAISAVGGSDEQTFYQFDIDPNLLHNGNNVIAVEIHQSAANSTDISFDASLVASIQSNPGLTINSSLHLLARVLDASVWSPVAEATLSTAVAAAAGNLAVTEVHYHPAAMPGATTPPLDDPENFEFIELRNIGPETIDLTGVQFTVGITFAFSAGDVIFLAPGQSIVVVSERTAFEARYGTGILIAGVYSGNLSNGGERIRLVDSANVPIQDFTYDDDPATTPAWPQSADGDGYSLTVRSVAGNYNLPANWRASHLLDGTPGYDENDNPSSLNLNGSSVDENDPQAIVGVLSASDPNVGDTLTFSLVDNAGGRFALDGLNLVVAPGVQLDYETLASFTVTVRVVDAGGLALERNFAISVTNVNESPADISLSNSSIDENRPAGTTVGTFSSTDPDAPQTTQAFTYTLLAGDTAAFTIDSAGNLKTSAVFNFEAHSSYTITVRSTDQGNLTVDKTFTITVTDANDAPVLHTGVAINLDPVAEDSTNPAGTLVSSLLAGMTDVDAGALRGVAVSGVSGSGGTWQYTLDNGATWLNFNGPRRSSARLLPADSSTRIRFVPTANFNGSANLWLIAWDQTQGAPGDVVDLSIGGSTGGTTAFSTAVKQGFLTVTAVNDA